MKNYEKRELNYMPFDKVFYENGMPVNCHATGAEVLVDGIWWNEYVSPSGELYLGK